MKKVLHLINSEPFLKWVKTSLIDDEIQNNFVVLNLVDTDVDKEEGCTRHLSVDEAGKSKLLDLINSSDVVIHYFLDYTKSELILKSNENVKHYWYFFGADIYQQMELFRSNLYFSQTKKWMRFNVLFRFKLELRALKYRVFLRKPSPTQLLKKSFDRIENVLWYVEDEINWIKSKTKLPKFKYHKFFEFNQVIPFEKSGLDIDSKKILIGNSCSPENNHLDILERIELNVNYSYGLPFNYGEPANYRSFVKSKFLNKLGANVELLESKMELNDYYNWLNSFPTAIMYHNRQQALGNIFYLIANGTKLYLSETNIIFKWLLKNGITVFSFENDFINDQNSSNLILDSELRTKNYSKLKVLLSEKSTFIDSLKKN